VQAVLAARIDRLPAEAKRLLQTAAVLGTEVPLPLLQAIAELPEAVLQRHLTSLQSAEFLYETRLFPEHEYTFKHALTHEVAYSSLLLERRRVLHARIVEALEALAGDRVDEQVERLAHHALRGEVWDKVLAYGRQAGEKAMARSAYREAVMCFEQALSALQHLPESRARCEQAIDLRFDLRNALHPLGERVRILDYLREAETLAQALGDQGRLGRIFSYRTHYFFLTGDHTHSIESGQHALAIAAVLADFPVQVATNLLLGRAHYHLGDYRRAMDFLGWTVASTKGSLRHERFGLAGPVSVTSLTWLVCCLAELGAFGEGSARGDEGVQIAEAVDLPYGLINAYFGVGYLHLRKGELPKAIAMLERALPLCQLVPIWFPWSASALGAAYALSGRVTEALPLLEQAVEQAASTKLMASHALQVAWLSESHLLASRMEKAITLAHHALDLSREHQERGNQAYALRLLGDIAARRDPLESEPTVAHYQQALTLADALGMRPLQAHCHRGLGTLYAGLGQWEQARSELGAARDLYQAMAMTFWLPQVEAVLAQTEER
jgi:tetratricopeptide (TPR) repeat protein